MARRQEGLEGLSRHEAYGIRTSDGQSQSLELSYTSVDGVSALSYIRPMSSRSLSEFRSAQG